MARTKGQRASAAAASKARTEVRRMIPHFEDAGNGPEVKIGPAKAPVFPLLLMGIGGYLMWFGIHYWRSDVKWPSDPVKALLQGKGIPAGSTATPQSAYLAAYTGSAATGTPSPSAAPAASGAGETLSQTQVEQLWVQQGGPQDTAAFASRVAMAESGGRTAVTSANPDGGTNVGLFQLDTPRGVGAGYSVAQLQDPVTNTRITIMATNGGTDWTDWGDSVTAAVGYHYVPQLGSTG